MKIHQLVDSIYTTNEEREVLETIDQPLPLSSFTERDQTIINNLIRKSIISKVQYNGAIMVIRNEL